MMNIRRREISLVSNTHSDDNEKIIDEIFAITSLTLDGFVRGDIKKMIEDPNNCEVKALLFESDGDVVGFVLVQIMPIALNRKVASVFRSMAGMRPEFRRKIELSNYALKLVIEHKLRHPFRAVFCFGLMAHPASFYIMQRALHEIYPRPKQEIPQQYKNLILRLAKQCGYVVTDSERLTGVYQCRSSSIKSIESDEVHNFWWNHSSRYVTDFIARTGYEAGVGVFTLIPCTWKNMLLTLSSKLIQSAPRRTKVSTPLAEQ